ncbi:MAG TPA: tetratricopeptide repeat protein, partial [Smithellaceae bacterium]|nr:tetratricopeptide repeat protein [Smithellaceae bacterium]
MIKKFNINQKKSIIVIGILIILIMGVYWPVQHYGFIYFDDDVYITQNSHVQSGITMDGLCWAFSTKYFGLWNPMTWLSFMFDYQLYGFNAGGYHWTNVILHIFNAILLFFLFRNMTGALWRSAFVAALFAIHPINVESVVWISERKNVLSTFFWMTTMLCYLWYVRQPEWKRYLPVLVSFALGLMSKPMLVTMPFVLLLMDYWPLQRTEIYPPNNIAKNITKKEKISFLILEKIPLFILSALTILITMYTPGQNAEPQFLRTTDFSERTNNAIFSYVIYVKKLFWPTDLSIFYLYLNISAWRIFLCAALLILVTIFVCRYFRRYPYVPVGWFWYLGTLVPVIGIVTIGDHTMADRYAYVPFIGLFVMIVWSMEHVSVKFAVMKKPLIFISVVVILLLVWASHQQIKKWATTEILFEDVIKKNPNNYFAYQVVGQEMAKKGENDRALNYYDLAIKANPRFWSAYNNKGLILQTMGRREEALENFQQAIQVNKFSADAYYNIGLFYLEDRKLDKTIEYSLKTIQVQPDYQEAYNILGIALVEQGKINEGIIQFEKVLKI